MPNVLMLAVAVWAGLIIVAACVTVMHWRRGGGQPSTLARDRRRVAAGMAGTGTVSRQAAVVTGHQPEVVRQGRRPDVPAEPRPAAQSEVGRAADAEPGSSRPGAEPDLHRISAEVVTASERIARFYDEADRPVADFLMTLGWIQKQQTRGPE
jgi:hypothetical protein